MQNSKIQRKLAVVLGPHSDFIPGDFFALPTLLYLNGGIIEDSTRENKFLRNSTYVSYMGVTSHCDVRTGLAGLGIHTGPAPIA